MISFDICKDAGWVTERMSQPDVAEMSFPDGADAPSEAQILLAMSAGGLDFVRICADDVPLGFFLLELKFPLIEIHTVISKEHRGPVAFSAARSFIKNWLFQNYQQCEVLMTQVPKYNRPAALFALRAGMKKSGIAGDSFCKNGKCESMEIFEIRKGE